MTEKNKFFSDARAQLTLTRAHNNIAALTTNSDFEANRNKMIAFVLDAMRNRPNEWEMYCELNIEWIGDHFLSSLDADVLDERDRLDDVFSTCFRFLFELFLSIKNDLSREFERVRKFGIENIDQFSPNAKSQIDFAIRDMPIAILKRLLNSDHIDSLKDVSNVFETAKTATAEWKTDLDEREKRVLALKKNLDQYEHGFNFVGLYQGFDDLAKAKEKERNDAIFWLRVLGTLIVVPIGFELFLIWQNLDQLEKLRTAILISLLPSFAISALLIFYFRILLHNFNGVRSQLLQIELRKTLCRFIQSYVDYSEKMKEKNSESLAKFETVIFSGLVSSEDKLPSTFDGVEQLGNLLNAIKK